ncbi:MAG TPA: hypothetical protein VMB84_18670 [Stellaceae bacterium]|nr:hypothetical protein [Stellaceae bacterium]
MRVLAALLLVACFALAGCAASDRKNGDSPFGGFYGGVSGGALP